jgi:hypothetical protein
VEIDFIVISQVQIHRDTCAGREIIQQALSLVLFGNIRLESGATRWNNAVPPKWLDFGEICPQPAPGRGFCRCYLLGIIITYGKQQTIGIVDLAGSSVHDSYT